MVIMEKNQKGEYELNQVENDESIQELIEAFKNIPTSKPAPPEKLENSVLPILRKVLSETLSSEGKKLLRNEFLNLITINQKMTFTTKIPQRSLLIRGEWRIGKTLLMRNWSEMLRIRRIRMNRANHRLHRYVSNPDNEILWRRAILKRMELSDSFWTEETTIRTAIERDEIDFIFAQIKRASYVFIDDLFFVPNWNFDRGTLNGSKLYKGYKDLWDLLVESRKKFIIATTNNDYQEVVKEKAIQARISEVFKESQIILTRK